MANTFITPDVLAREATLVLMNEAILFQLMRNPADEARFTGTEKVGDTIRIVTPAASDVRDFTGTATSRDAVEGEVNLVVEKQLYDQINVTSKQMTLELDRFSERIVQPIMKGFAEELAVLAATKLSGIGHFVGTAGAPPQSKADILEGKRKLATNKASKRGRIAVVDEFAEASILGVDGFSDADRRGDGGLALREASMGRVYAIDWMMDQSIPEHTAGTMQAESPLVDVGGGVLEGATVMDIDDVGAGTQTILEGDLFTVADVDDYTGVFTNDTTAIGGQITGATFTPAAPVGGFGDSDAITIIGNHTKNVAWAPGAFTAVTFPPVASQGSANSASFFDPALGLGVRITFGWSSTSLSDTITFDLLAGVAVRQEDLAVIYLG